MTETDQPVQVLQNESAFGEGLRAEGIAKVRLVRGKPVADVGALRKYHREYYHANKQEGECEHCKSKFSGESALVRHQRSAQKCLLQRARAELEVLRKL
jgi:hypothetical protein